MRHDVLLCSGSTHLTTVWCRESQRAVRGPHGGNRSHEDSFGHGIDEGQDPLIFAFTHKVGRFTVFQ